MGMIARAAGMSAPASQPPGAMGMKPNYPLWNALNQMGGAAQMQPSQEPPAGPGNPLMRAFSNSPQFQQQLRGLANLGGQQGPGMVGPQFTPPPGGPMSAQVQGVTPIAPEDGGGGAQNDPNAMLRAWMALRMGGMGGMGSGV